jgi:hypothetical protein
MPVKTVPLAFDEKEYAEASSLKKKGETWPGYVLRLVKRVKECGE